MTGHHATRVRRRRAAGLLALGLTVALGACGGGDDDGDDDGGSDPGTTLPFTSAAFFDGSPIPERHTCDGDGISPSLAWTGLPADTATMRLSVVDPDAPSGDFVHWDVSGIPPRVAGVGEGTPPPGTEGANSAGSIGWVPPCPPAGDGPHRYVFTLRALDGDGEVVATGTFFGTYER